MDFKNGLIVKIYKSQVDPILVGGRLRRPQTKMGISSGPDLNDKSWTPLPSFIDKSWRP